LIAEGPKKLVEKYKNDIDFFIKSGPLYLFKIH